MGVVFTKHYVFVILVILCTYAIFMSLSLVFCLTLYHLQGFLIILHYQLLPTWKRAFPSILFSFPLIFLAMISHLHLCFSLTCILTYFKITTVNPLAQVFLVIILLDIARSPADSSGRMGTKFPTSFLKPWYLKDSLAIKILGS